MSNLSIADIKEAIITARWAHGAEIVGERAAGILAVQILGVAPQTLRDAEVAAVLEGYTDAGVRSWLTAWLLASPAERRPMETGVVVEWSGEWPAPLAAAIASDASPHTHEACTAPKAGDTVKVSELVPGDRVRHVLDEATFVSRGPHPLYPGLALVTWCMSDGTWYHDALDPAQEVGVLVESDRTDNLRAALLNGVTR